MRLTLTSALAALAVLSPILAHAEAPWGKVDMAGAPAMHETACVSCHVRMYGGDGSKMYTRDGRVLSTQLDLLQRVAACNAQVSAGWFPEDEAAVAAWLNQEYYRFTE